MTSPTGLGTVVALRHERLAALAKAFLQETNSQSNQYLATADTANARPMNEVSHHVGM